jgi:hypothetical protein
MALLEAIMTKPDVPELVVPELKVIAPLTPPDPALEDFT